jgi:hypothetical protein
MALGRELGGGSPMADGGSLAALVREHDTSPGAAAHL